MITGGVKSGKSRYALELGEKLFPREKYFLATAIPFDREMEDRILRHQKDRGPGFITIEEPIEIQQEVKENTVLDCLTIWMNNLFHYKQEDRWEEILTEFLDNVKENVIIVTNENGLGNIPMNSFTRKYNRYLGAANYLTASRMDSVYFMISGIPMKVK